MLGTDYPFPLGELEPGKLIESMKKFSPKLKVVISNDYNLIKSCNPSC